MNDPNYPSFETLNPGQAQPAAPSAPAQASMPAQPLAYPAPPGSGASRVEAKDAAMVPVPPAQAPAMHYPQAAPPPAGDPAGAPPQIVHNTVVQNHYHNNASTQLVRTSSRDRTIAVLLAVFLGALGVHRFYLGRTGSGVIMLLMTLTGVLIPVVWIWSIVDVVSLAATSREQFELRYNCSLAPGILPPAGG